MVATVVVEVVVSSLAIYDGNESKCEFVLSMQLIINTWVILHFLTNIPEYFLQPILHSSIVGPFVGSQAALLHSSQRENVCPLMVVVHPEPVLRSQFWLHSSWDTPKSRILQAWEQENIWLHPLLKSRSVLHALFLHSSKHASNGSVRTSFIWLLEWILICFGTEFWSYFLNSV